MKRTKKGLKYSRKTSREYPSKITVNEIFIEDKEGNNENYFFDDLHFAEPRTPINTNIRSKRKKAVSDFLKEIKKADSITECDLIYNKIHNIVEEEERVGRE